MDVVTLHADGHYNINNKGYDNAEKYPVLSDQWIELLVNFRAKSNLMRSRKLEMPLWDY